MLAATSPKALWYLTRGTGLIAMLLLTASVILGIVEVKRWRSPRWPRFLTAGLHRNLSLLSVAFLSIHVATTVIDGFAPIGWLDAVVPFRSPYRPVWLGLGTVAVDLLVALVATSLLRGRIGYRAWRAVHWAAYACWPAALVHGLGTGSDTRYGWAALLAMVCLASVAGSVWWRLASEWRPLVRRARPALAAATAASVIVPVAAVAFLLVGPLQPGWARRAGTPSGLAGQRRAVPEAPSANQPAPLAAGPEGAASVAPTLPPETTGPGPVPTTGAPAAGFAVPTSATFQGHLVQDNGAEGQATVTVNATLSGPGGVLTVVLRGRALAGGGIEMSSGQVSLGPPGAPTLVGGTVTALNGSQLTVSLRSPSGGRASRVIDLVIGRSGSVRGTLRETGASADEDA